MKINYKLLPIKAHYFFFMATGGPTVPFLQVHGKQLGISPLIIGSIFAVLPLLYLIAKPIFGFIIDYSQAWKKTFIVMLIIIHSCYIGIFFLPALPGAIMPDHFENVSYALLSHCNKEHHASEIVLCNGTKDTNCDWICENKNFSTRLSFYATERKTIMSLDTACLINVNDTSFRQENITTNYNCNVTCDNFEDDHCLYTSIIFWSFTLLISLGNICMHFCALTSDGICLAILGQNEQLKYGMQRLWGTIGYGLTACISGYVINLWPQEETYKTYTFVSLFVIILVSINLVCCSKLKASLEPGLSTTMKNAFALLKFKFIIIFLCFTAFTGILHGVTINFLFWYLEDLANATGYTDKIKLIEGLIVGVQNCGEILCFFLSSKILKKFGYGYTFAFCFICYALRLGLISLASMPWWILPIEFFMNGLSFSIGLAAIVAYANSITPPGATVTVQGVVQGMYDGLGHSIGSLLGGIFYKKFGGTITLRIFSTFAALLALTYLILHILYLKNKTESNVEWKKPDDALKHCVAANI
ncbi:hypothetical protein P5V15_004547 [Pogonomyrmex californicus]